MDNVLLLDMSGEKMYIAHLISMLCYILACNGSLSDGTVNTKNHEYCVIGAGPAGLQMGYFLERASRDYVIYEKGSSAGTFYKKYPIHRKLISINKRFTGKTNKEFNLRHDWNSLISDDESLKFTKYSKEFFPDADVLVKYLNDFATKLKLNVQYNTAVGGIKKISNGTLFHMSDQLSNQYICKYLIIATGISKPNIPKFEGSELVQGYEDLSLDLDEYEGQSVLILGRGNSAFEVAQHIMPSTNVIHMLARSRVKLAWATHYVGDLRAVNNGLLDTYQLKSLDGIFEGDVEDLPVRRSDLDGRLYIDQPGDADIIPGGKNLEDLDNDATREGYDRIIRCLGFNFDDSIFHPNFTISRAGKGRRKKYPKISHFYGSTDYPNLYFAGTNTHSLDLRKSAGAFIHGYRYTARTLHRILEWVNHGIKWPHVHFTNLQDLTPHIIKRMSEGSDIYQMFGVLCDVVLYNKNKTEATYLEAFPCSLAPKIKTTSGHEADHAFMMIALEYGKNFSGPGKDPFNEERVTSIPSEAHRSNFLHPILYHYDRRITIADQVTRPKKWILPVPDRIHHVLEDFTTKFDGHETHILGVRRFIEMNTGQDLRFFFAEQCFMLALTTTSLPLGCRPQVKQPSSQLVATNPSLRAHLDKMPPHFLPLRVFPSDG
ncbi:FAD-dependent oxidoreductase domain-containing protein 2-like [Clavelina lepadiformis]|uniref:FAD-dependent oxidoreductase domain-containing protein 2-like n=1 Tax=Clavelina lepadiformis TaxID=159417 RepID=UPI0040432BE1